MKKLIVIHILFALVLALSGCADNSYRGEIDFENQGDITMPIPVRLMIGAPDEISDIVTPSSYSGTKGSGVITQTNQLLGKDFYVYAFNNEVNTSLDETSAENMDRCLIDGSLDNPGTLAGKRARISDFSNVVDWQDGEEPIFWPDGERSRQIYNIFAYFVDDIKLRESSYIRTPDKVSVGVEIDGSQDIMSSKAEMTSDQKALFPDEESLNHMMHYCYSYYAAQNGINPVLVFKHHLTKLDFTMIPGRTLGFTSRITVNSVEIYSRYKAEFVVADKNHPTNTGLIFSEEYKNLPLREKDGSPLRDDYTVTTYSNEPSNLDKLRKRVGSGLMVSPDKEYIAYVTLSEVRDNGTIISKKLNKIPLNTGKYFEAGNSYNITFTLMGASAVQTSVELTEWADGGDIIIDEEEKPEI